MPYGPEFDGFDLFLYGIPEGCIDRKDVLLGYCSVSLHLVLLDRLELWLHFLPVRYASVWLGSYHEVSEGFRAQQYDRLSLSFMFEGGGEGILAFSLFLRS